MRKEYLKPEITFEDFSLNTDIAAGCEAIIDNQSYMTCPYIDGRNGGVFVDTVTGCDYKPQGGEHNGLCYHNPNESKNVFNS